MTWQILVEEPKGGLFGLAAASRFFALGALVAMRAGEAQGGEKRGEQSAAIVVPGGELRPRPGAPRHERDSGVFDRRRIEAIAARALHEDPL